MKKIIKEITPIKKKAENVPTKKRVAAYARVSTEQDEQLHSLQVQRDYYENYIKSNPDWELVNIYYDEGITGTSLKRRKGFNQMITDALDGKIDVILVKSVSRFARNTIDALQTTRDLKLKGVPVFFEKENIDSMDPKGEFMLTLFCSFAQEESKSISDNIKWSIRNGYKHGKFTMHTEHLLGFKKTSAGKIIIDKEQAKLVKMIYKLFLEGFNNHQLQVYLENHNILTPLGSKKWTYAVINSILTNEKYCGDAILQKKFSIDVVLHTLKKNEGELPQYRIYNNHPAIIPKSTWEYVQELYSIKYTDNSYPLSNKIECGLCHKFYQPRRNDRKKDYGKVLLYWVCNSRYKRKCNGILIHDEQMTEASTLAFENLYSSYKDEIINDLRLIASKTITTKTKQKEFSNKLSSIYPLNKDIIDYFTKFLIRKIYVVDNDYLLYEFIDDTLYRYELGTWSIKENRKINRKRREFKNKDYWGKKPKED